MEELNEYPILDIFTDGSFRDEKASWAFIIIENNTVIFQDCGVLEGNINEIRNIAGELAAVMRAITYCKKHNIRARIYHDLEGSYNWVKDLFSREKAWKRNNEYTQKYRLFVEKNKNYVHEFKWVKGHQNNGGWNDYVDELAASAYLKRNEREV